ncbi:hypothetical protein JCM1393_00080 [Clostridium carnis]
MERKNLLNEIAIIYHWMKEMFKNFEVSEVETSLNSTQARVIIMIYNHKDNTMSKISRGVGLEKGSFTSVIDNLIEEGYVIRNRNVKDRRKISLELTEKGRLIAEDMQNIMLKKIEAFIYKDGDEKAKEYLNAIRVLSELSPMAKRS